MTADGPKSRPYVDKSAHRRGEAAYRASVRVFSGAFIVIGVVVLATTLLSGGGPLAVGTVLGLAFVAVGAGRLWVSSRMSA